MTASLAPSATPSHAIRTWVDPNNLFFELPSLNGPCVLSFPRTAAGFTAALAVLFVRHEVEAGGQIYHRPPSPTSTIPDKDGITPAQRQQARDLLKQLKII